MNMTPDQLLAPTSPPAIISVLVVDDDESVCRLWTKWIGALGHRVEIANDADTALDMMRTHEIDVAVCDINMPGRDGIWLIDQITREYPDVAIVVATGRGEMDPRVTLRRGVEAYLLKPVNFGEFAATLYRARPSCAPQPATAV
jgi:CheY-like chemotaxis protein